MCVRTNSYFVKNKAWFSSRREVAVSSYIISTDSLLLVFGE